MKGVSIMSSGNINTGNGTQFNLGNIQGGLSVGNTFNQGRKQPMAIKDTFQTMSMGNDLGAFLPEQEAFLIAFSESPNWQPGTPESAKELYTTLLTELYQNDSENHARVLAALVKCFV